MSNVYQDNIDLELALQGHNYQLKCFMADKVSYQYILLIMMSQYFRYNFQIINIPYPITRSRDQGFCQNIKFLYQKYILRSYLYFKISHL